MKKTADLKAMEKIAKDLAEKTLRQKPKKSARVIGLKGELGAGKTTFARFFAKTLGVREKIQSPTFIIMKKFQIPSTKHQTNFKHQISKFKTLVHIDAYRIEKPEELLKLGWEELASNPQNIILIEWAERVGRLLPRDCIRIKFRIADDEKRREISIN